MNEEQFEKSNNKHLNALYKDMSNDILNQLRNSDVDPQDVELDSEITPEELLDLLAIKSPDYLLYRKVNASIKKLSKRKEQPHYRR